MRARIAGGMVVATVIAAGLATVAAPRADATFPGANGKLAFDAFVDNTSRYDIFVMNLDGSGRVPITSTTDDDKGAAWSPDGTKIAFTRQLITNSVFGEMDVWVMDADGSNPVNLTNSPGRDFDPAWSPDGTKITFASWRNDPSPGGCSPCNADIFVMDADGTDQVALTTTPSSIEMAPDWFGTKIVYESRPLAGGAADLIVANADGSGSPTNLTNSTADDKQPAWWPDGSKIAFSTKPTGAGTSYDVATIPAAGGSVTPLFTTPDSWDLNPSPLPDGTGVAFDADGSLPSAVPQGSATGKNAVVCKPGKPCTNLGDGQNPSTSSAGTPCPDITVTKKGAVETEVGDEFPSTELVASGGRPFYHWSKVRGPNWVHVSPSPGTIYGRGLRVGERTVTVRATDADGCEGQATFSVMVTPRVEIRKFGSFETGVELLIELIDEPDNQAPPAALAAAAEPISHDLRYRRAPLGTNDFGSYHSIASDTEKSRIHHVVRRGFKHCYSARVAGTGAPGWGPNVCERVPKG